MELALIRSLMDKDFMMIIGVVDVQINYLVKTYGK